MIARVMTPMVAQSQNGSASRSAHEDEWKPDQPNGTG
jgi:hypothetical protein